MLFKKLVDYIYNIKKKEFEIENIDNILTNQQHLQGQINANRRAFNRASKLTEQARLRHSFTKNTNKLVTLPSIPRWYNRSTNSILRNKRCSLDTTSKHSTFLLSTVKRFRTFAWPWSGWQLQRPLFQMRALGRVQASLLSAHGGPGEWHGSGRYQPLPNGAVTRNKRKLWTVTASFVERWAG